MVRLLPSGRTLHPLTVTVIYFTSSASPFVHTPTRATPETTEIQIAQGLWIYRYFKPKQRKRFRCFGLK